MNTLTLNQDQISFINDYFVFDYDRAFLIEYFTVQDHGLNQYQSWIAAYDAGQRIYYEQIEIIGLIAPLGMHEFA